MPLLTLNVFGASGDQRRNFDGVIYIHYTAPPYSARISATYLLPFGKVWLCSVSFMRYSSLSRSRQKAEGFWPPIFWKVDPTFLWQIVSTIYYSPCLFGKIWLSSVC